MMVNHDVRQEIVEELRHFCYICHRRIFLMCGDPRVEVGGCCSGAEWGKTRYIRPVYAHLPCYHSKEVKRRRTIYTLPTIKKIIGRYAKQELKHIQTGLDEGLDAIQNEFLNADKVKYQGWLRELK